MVQKERNIITDKLVIEKTGKPLHDWYDILDKKGALKMAHGDIFNLIAATPGLKELGLWNQNLLTTSYEWERGLKQRGERDDGFEISLSKTVPVPLPVLYRSWMEDSTRSKWLGKEDIVIRKATENKSARITWSDNSTSLSVDFYAKGAGKSQVVVQHQKIGSAQKATRLKEFWAVKLEALKYLLEK